LAATSVGATTATLNGNVTANGLATNAWFEWATNSGLSGFSSTPTQSVGSGTTSQPVNAALTGLATGTTYFYRVAASNSSGTTKGSIASFSKEDFTIIALPDTQYYSCGTPCSSNPSFFSNQTQWIVNNKEALNIVYVAHEGDIVNDATTVVEWDRASDAMSLLEDPVTTSLPDGIPYGVLPGNHDQESTYNYYNQYFGIERFSGRGYYGGSFSGANNNNNYGLFRAGGMDFIVINLEFSPSAEVLTWADALLGTYSNRRAIVVSHDIIDIGNPGAFSFEGQAIYNALKDNSNLFLMLCGHAFGEGRRMDVYNGHSVNTLLANYQTDVNGGSGFLRILRFSPVRNEITVETYSPSLDQYERDSDSQFILQYDMGGSQ
jgi:hypothetical protein